MMGLCAERTVERSLFRASYRASVNCNSYLYLLLYPHFGPAPPANRIVSSRTTALIIIWPAAAAVQGRPGQAENRNSLRSCDPDGNHQIARAGSKRILHSKCPSGEFGC